MTVCLDIHVPDGAVRQCRLDDLGPTGVVIGRDPRCGVVIGHDSVSRQHLKLSLVGENRFRIEDLGSKNGTRIGGRALHGAQDLDCGSWFALGDIYCQLICPDPKTQQRQTARQDRRRHSSMAWNSRLSHGSEAHRLIADLLQGIVEVAEARRGFLLSLDQRGDWRVRACYGISPEQLNTASFNGSRSAVDRVIAQRRAVYLSDHRDQQWLASRDSVISSGIQALAALPLMREDRIVGVAYADTDEQQRCYTELDAQLLQALVDHAEKVISALEVEAGLAEVSAMLQVSAGQIRHSETSAPCWRSAAGWRQ